MVWLALFMATYAAIAAVSMPPARVPSLLMGWYWLLSFMGQSFAFPLALACGLGGWFTDDAARWILLLAAALFAFVHWRNRQAGRLLLDAVGARDRTIPWHAGIAPFLNGGTKVRRIKNLKYGGDSKRNRLDLIVSRQEPAGPMPILIHVHGGAWVLGDKDQQSKPLLHHLAANGWLCVDATYRLGPKDRGPAWIVDVLRAIAWVRENAAEHGGDPTRIALTGGSAGGHLTALAALTHDDPAFKPGFEDADCSVAMAVPLYGRYDFLDRKDRLSRNREAVIDKFMAQKVMPGGPADCPALWSAVSPIDRIRADAPPMLVVHGTGDTLLPYGDAHDFADSLSAISKAPVAYVELPGIQHAWDMANSALTWAHVRAIETFLKPLTRPSA